MPRFVAHRVGDTKLLRLIRRFLKAGVPEAFLVLYCDNFVTCFDLNLTPAPLARTQGTTRPVQA
jgi:hypothetical protein